MKLLQTIVSSNGFRDPDHNLTRLAHLERLLAVAVREAAHLVLLPGGFLTVRTQAQVAPAAAEVARRAEAAGVAVVGGIDAFMAPEDGNAEEDLVRAGRLPFFGFAVGPAEPRVADDRWRQVSIRNHHPDLVPDDRVPGPDRVVTVAGLRVGVLLCGELSNWRVRESWEAGPPDVVVDAGHISMGQGLIPGMKSWNAGLGSAVAHAQHVLWWGASHHFVAADGTRDSTPTEDTRAVGNDDFWIAWCVRTV